jgi:hypothetical protein
MPWATITTDDVLAEFSLAEQTSLTGASGALDVILANVVNSVRGQILAGGNMLSSIAQTVPDQLRDEVISIARWRFLSSVPLLQDFKTDDRRSLYNDAMNTIRAVSMGSIKVELPNDAASLLAASTTDSPVNQFEQASRQPRMVTACLMRGLT